MPSHLIGELKRGSLTAVLIHAIFSVPRKRIRKR
jgi:hypothetical protein